MSIQDDTHDKLTKAYLEYFKANERFEKNRGVRTMQDTRKWLREIRTLAKIRMEEVKSTYDSKKDTKAQQARVSIHMQWTYKGQEVTEIPEGIEGFVYLITNLTNNRKYVGKKLAKFKKTRPPLKGRKNKRREKVESDWRDYWGSSEHLLEDVQNIGPEKFTREILHYCESKGVLSYLEAKEQFDRRVLETDEYYNGIINVRVGSSKVLKEALKKIKQARNSNIVWSRMLDSS